MRTFRVSPSFASQIGNYRKIMAESFNINSLNRAQRKAVETIHGPVLILAGAGTGKTRTVTCRIAHMIEKGIPASSILAVTFTNKAANEMNERVAGMLSKKQAKGVTISTFHSLCVRILREDCSLLGYKENFSIFTGSDQNEILRKLIIRHGGRTEKIEPRDVLSELGKMKNKGGTTAMIGDEFIAGIAQQYLRDLKAQNAMDFDDLLVLAEKLLRENAVVREKWRSKFRYITVDEFQDTNSLQMSLLNQLVGIEKNVCVVGDDDQSIYGWRGADISNILEFERFFPDPTIIKLEENYRCTKPILDAANSLIKHNAGRREKQLITNKTGGDPVRVVCMPGDLEEAEFIVDEIHEERRKSTRAWEDFAILFRANTQSRIIEQALRDQRVPYRMVGAQSFFDKAEVKDIISYLSIMVNPSADLHLLRVINCPPRGIGEKTIVLATDWSRDHHESVWDALKDEKFTDLLSKKAQTAILEFVAMIEQYRDKFQDEDENMARVLREFLDEIGYDDYVRRYCKTEAESDKRLGTIGEVVGTLRAFSQPGKNLRQFIENITLDNKDNDDDVEKKSGVCLITLHAAKGLEFPIVYLVGMEQGILPHKRSLEDGNCDEERRLLYVGITRARQKLTLTYCGSRIRYGEKVLCEHSSFLNEIPEDQLVWENYEEMMTEEVSEDDAKDFFASLRGLLSEED